MSCHVPNFFLTMTTKFLESHQVACRLLTVKKKGWYITPSKTINCHFYTSEWIKPENKMCDVIWWTLEVLLGAKLS